mmetsp:Transcript_18995/g.35274  ORF Transcript_18995/g.35274 Transcript_18995/m.35274 type:complete len:211 (+) Transcript_18995:227-859(+)
MAAAGAVPIPLNLLYSPAPKRSQITSQHRVLHHYLSSAQILHNSSPSTARSLVKASILSHPLYDQIHPSIRSTICKQCGSFLQNESHGTKIKVVKLKDGRKGKGTSCGTCGAKIFSPMPKKPKRRKPSSFKSKTASKPSSKASTSSRPPSTQRPQTSSPYVHKKRPSSLAFSSNLDFISVPSSKSSPKPLQKKNKKVKSNLDKFLNSLNN